MSEFTRDNAPHIHVCSIALLSCARACIGCSDAAMSGEADKPAPQVVHACIDCAGACLSLQRLVTSSHGASVEIVEMCAEACRSCERICHIYGESHPSCVVAAQACGRAADACRDLALAMGGGEGNRATETA
jgi:hypothetical protein